jgi:hypothetical protein
MYVVGRYVDVDLEDGGGVEVREWVDRLRTLSQQRSSSLEEGREVKSVPSLGRVALLSPGGRSFLAAFLC